MDDSRRSILEGLDQLSIDADRNRSGFLRVPAHQKLGSEDYWIVVGARGMGKTTLANVLIGGREQTAWALPLLSHDKAIRIDGWSRSGREHIAPAPDDVPFDFWLSKLVDSVEHARSSLRDSRPPRVRSRRRHELMHRLYELDAELERDDTKLMVVYDGLEAFQRWEEFAADLVALWAEAAPRLQAISPKIFLRTDIRDRLFGRSADLAKLGPHTMTLEWSDNDIWRLLLFTFANSSDAARALLESEGFRGHLSDGRWNPSDVVPEQGEGSRDAFATVLAGRLMGAGATRGHTWRWITRHLADGNNAIAPRSAVHLLACAAGAALKEPIDTGPLLTAEHLREGLRHTAKHRAEELKEERPDIVDLLTRLEGATVPIDGADLALRLFHGDGAVALEAEEASEVIARMVQLGVLVRRSDARYDLPDLYRFGYGVKRRGGTALHKA